QAARAPPVSQRGARRARDRAARGHPREARGLHGARRLRAEHDRARRQGRERPDRLRLARRPRARPRHRRRQAVLRRRVGGRDGARRRDVPDRPRGRVRGSDALRGAARPRPAAAGRLPLAEQRRAGLGESVRPPRLAVRGRRRRRRGEGGLRRDPVRLRPLPERRRRLADRLPAPGGGAEGRDDRPVPAVRVRPAASARRARLSRRVRPGGDARPTDRPGAQEDRDVPRRDLPDGLPVALLVRRVGDRRSGRLSGAHRRAGPVRLPAPGEGPGRADPVAPGLLARTPVRPDRGDRPDRRRPQAARPGIHALESRGRVHARRPGRVILHAPPPPAPLALVAPAEREVSFGHVVGRLPRGTWAVVVRAGGRSLAVRRVTGGSFDFTVSLPRRDTDVRVTAYAAGKVVRRAIVHHVFGLPRSADPRAVRPTADPALARTVGALARSFPGTSGFYVEDLVTGRGAAWNARARFPAASTLKVAIAVEALRSHAGKPAPGSYLDSLLRRMLVDSDNDAANETEATFGGGSRVDDLLRGVGIGDTWMGGGYLHGTPAL